MRNRYGTTSCETGNEFRGGILRCQRSTLEFKRVSGKMVGKALETMCAFANCQGGDRESGCAPRYRHGGEHRARGFKDAQSAHRTDAARLPYEAERRRGGRRTHDVRRDGAALPVST